MNILIFGISGGLGRELKKYLSNNGFFVLGTYNRKSVDFDNCFQVDLSKPESVNFLLNKTRYQDIDVVINTIALTDVDLCESKPNLALDSNVATTKNTLEYAKRKGTRYIYISTNDIFGSADKKKYTENDVPAPINVYSQTKRVAEKLVLTSNIDFLILRGSILSLYNSAKNTFLNWIYESLKENKSINLFNDQFYNPISAISYSEIIGSLINKQTQGILHVGVDGVLNRELIGREFARQLKLSVDNIQGCSIDTAHLIAPRSKHSVLAIDELKLTLKKNFLLETEIAKICQTLKKS